MLRSGDPLTGVRWSGGEVPVADYEISFAARRIAGDDFFCALTFPVDSSFATLVLGGWRGNVTGLSSIDGLDASQNFTGTFRRFKNGQWYRVRLQVSDAVRAWVDEKLVVEVAPGDGALSLRREMEPLKPLGFASWKSAGEIRDISLKKIHPDAH